MRSLFIVGVLIAGAVCAGQAPPPKKAAPALKAPAAQSPFVCPDAEAQQGCKSYQELLKAKDKGLPDHGYFCFRKKEDSFFTITFNKPYFVPHWDEEAKTMVPDDKPRPGIGHAETYRDGVVDSVTMPHFNFTGKWMLLLESPYFTSETLNFKN